MIQRVPKRWLPLVQVLPVLVALLVGAVVLHATDTASASRDFCFQATQLFIGVTQGDTPADPTHDPRDALDRLRRIDANALVAALPSRLMREGDVLRREVPRLATSLGRLKPGASVLAVVPPELVRAYVAVANEFQRDCR